MCFQLYFQKLLMQLNTDNRQFKKSHKNKKKT